MSSEANAVAIRVANLSKRYEIYAQPQDRLKQAVLTAFQRFTGLEERRYFREFWALHDVSFEVRRGETVGIVGKNGAGKSTLLHLLVGTHAPTSGTIEVHGRVTALLELGSGFNPQFTGRENVYLNAAIMGLGREEIDRRFGEIEAFADIGDFIDQPVSTYSSGMYLRLAFSVQVCLDPDILIVDEALAVGDAYFVHRCFHRIRSMKEQGKTILFVSHDTGSVNSLCDRALWIDGGRLRLEGKPDDVTAHYRADLFRVDMRASPGGPAVSIPARVDGSESSKAPRKLETHVPNVDRRMGRGRCHIEGLALYREDGGSRLGTAKGGDMLVLRVSITNHAVDPGEKAIFGYEIFSPKGDNLAGTNTDLERVEIPLPPPGETATIEARFRLPVLHGGHYAITPAVATLSDAGVDIEDRIENALVFEVMGEREFGSWIKLSTEFSVDPGLASNPTNEDDNEIHR